MRQLNQNIVPLQAATSVTTDAVPAENLFYMSAQIAITGAGAGTMKLQASNDDTNGEVNTIPTNWSDIPSASVIVSGTGAFLIPKTEICYQYVRVVYTNTGSGTISIVIKAIGS